MRLGVHVSIAGKIYEAVDRAEALGCETMQIFSRNPRGWMVTEIPLRDATEFKSRRKEKNIFPLFVHIPYLINLASPEKALWERSIQAYIDDIQRADLIGAEHFVTHLGSHKGKGEGFGIERFAEGLNRAIAKYTPRLEVLLENTAGSGDSLGYTFAHLKGIIDRVKEKKKIGICFDTCHAYAAGYDIKTERGLKATLEEIDDAVGLERLKLVHINDAQGTLKSHLDRHEHIGKGAIGTEGFSRIVNHQKLRNLPFILETPKKDPKYDPMNLKAVRRLYK